MTFSISAGSEGRLESAVTELQLIQASTSVCGVKGCTASADWQAFKNDTKFDHYMRAHRIKVGKIEAVSPPGFGGTVKHMSEKHKDISNPHALAWYQYEKGDKSHIKPPKGTGAKTLSKKTSKKRSKALKKKKKDVEAHCGFCPEDLAKEKKKSLKAGPLTPTTTTKLSDDVMEESSQQGRSKKVEAGGPGSGRKPTWSSTKNKSELDALHNTLYREGFKYKSTSHVGKGQYDHNYKDKKEKLP